jgi:hypothetical protein
MTVASQIDCLKFVIIWRRKKDKEEGKTLESPK